MEQGDGSFVPHSYAFRIKKLETGFRIVYNNRKREEKRDKEALALAVYFTTPFFRMMLA